MRTGGGSPEIGRLLDPWSADDPVAPGAVEHMLPGDTPSPIRLLRSEVVGRVHAYGILGAPCEPRWLGIARLDPAEDAARHEETEDPAATGVCGVVLDGEGVPIEGAEVILYSSFYVRRDYYDHRVREIGRAWTDRDGAFDLRPLALDTVHFGRDGKVLATVRHPAFADVVAQSLDGILPGRTNTLEPPLRLTRQPVSVRGVIRDLAGNPVAGARVCASGRMNPVLYDKVERMVVLKDCPTAVTNEHGEYALSDFAPGTHELSIHVNLDCVLHVSGSWEGAREWSPRVRAGNGVRGRVLDRDGQPVSGAVVAGGGNWTPTNDDGTFWLDNVALGPLTLDVYHHAWRTARVTGVETNLDVDTTIHLTSPLVRLTLEVLDAEGQPVPLIAIDWQWSGAPPRFSPTSRYWHAAEGLFSVIVPEHALGARVSEAGGLRAELGADALATDGRLTLQLHATTER